MAAEPIKKAPGDWKCKVQLYLIAWYHTAKELPLMAYSPLEAQSSFASAESGRPVGGLSNIQIVRYRESPVGPYDEFLIVPGAFEYPVEVAGKRKNKRNIRITRIYVSSRDSCYNGRYNWNVPKHLARFDWKDLPNGATQLKIFPYDTAGDAAESKPSDVPLFQTTFKTVPYVPGFPMTTSLYRAMGINVSLVGPPLPQGPTEELVGTERWAVAMPKMFTWKSNLGWFDLRQADDDGKQVGEHANFWPTLSRWQLGLRLDDVDFDFISGEGWESPRSRQ